MKQEMQEDCPHLSFLHVNFRPKRFRLILVTDLLMCAAANPTKVSWLEKRRKSKEKTVKNGKRKGIKPVPKITNEMEHNENVPRDVNRHGVREEGRYIWSISA